MNFEDEFEEMISASNASGFSHRRGRVEQSRPRRFGEISLPIAAELYLRQKEIDKLQAKYHRTFQTKTAMAVAIVQRLVPKFTGFGKPIEVIFDGGYAKDTVLLPLDKLDNVTTITRLRRDAVVFELPIILIKKGRGRPKSGDGDAHGA